MINREELYRPIIYSPKSHQVESIWPSDGPYQLLDWQDLQALRLHPNLMMTAFIALLFPDASTVLAWGGQPEMWIENNRLRISSFVSVQFGQFVVNDTLASIEIPVGLQSETSGFRWVSVFAKSAYQQESGPRIYRNDRNTPAIDRVLDVPISEHIETEYQLYANPVNSPVIYNRKSGYVYLGAYRITAAGSDLFDPASADDLISYIHAKYGFNHPDGSVTRSKFQQGIIDDGGLSAVNSPVIALKDCSDEIMDARGTLNSLAARIVGVIDPDGELNGDLIQSMIVDRVWTLYFAKGELAKPNPFVYNFSTSKFELNMNAVRASGAACDTVITGRGFKPLVGGENEYVTPGTDTGFEPTLPAASGGEFGLDQYAIFASPTEIRWGSSAYPLNIGDGLTGVEGCNFRCRIHRDADGQHRITSWSQFDRADGTEAVWGNACEYMVIGNANLKDGYAEDIPPEAALGTFGNCKITISGLPLMVGATGKTWTRSLFVVLHNETETHFIGLYQGFLLRADSGYAPPPGYSEAEYWPVWWIETGLTSPDQYRHEFPAEFRKFLPCNDGDPVQFTIAWSKVNDGTWGVAVKCLNTGEIETIESIQTPIEIVSVSDGKSDAATAFGTDQQSPATVETNNFETEYYDDTTVPATEDTCKKLSFPGYKKGSCKVMVTGVTEPLPDPTDKAVMLAIGNSKAGREGCAGWVTLRHRTGADRIRSEYDVKMGMGKTYAYSHPDPAHCDWHSMQHSIPNPLAVDGVYEIRWDADMGTIEVISPLGESILGYMYDYEYQRARFAFDTVGQGDELGGWIAKSSGTIELIEFNGEETGVSHWCDKI